MYVQHKAQFLDFSMKESIDKGLKKQWVKSKSYTPIIITNENLACLLL